MAAGLNLARVGSGPFVSNRRVQAPVRMPSPMVAIFGVDVEAVVLLEAVQALVIGVATVVVARLLGRLFSKLAKAGSERSARQVGRILQAIVCVVGLLAIGATLKIDVSSVIIGLGAVSIAVAFALGTLINNLVAGFLLLADGTIRVGDEISVGGIEGRVVRIRTRALVLVMKDGSRVFVPNAFVMSNPVINRGREPSP